MDASFLRSFIRRRIQDQEDAEDILQDVYEEYLEATDLGPVIESLSGWLARVAQNRILDRFRKRKTQQNYIDEVSKSEQPVAPGPEEDWAATWIREALIAAVEALPQEQRTVFVMHEIEGKTFEQISIETGIGLNTLLARKRYAVQSLREQLKEIYDELE